MEQTERDRCIFGYWDGTANREIDPMEAGSVLESECPDYLTHLEQIVGTGEPVPVLPPGAVADSVSVGKTNAELKLLEVTRKMFGVAAFKFEDGKRSGLTRTETFDLLTQFLMFLKEAALKARPFSTSQPRASPSTPPDSTASHSSASGSDAGP